MTVTPRWLARYRDGERAVVWHELRQLGAVVRESPHAEEAQAVCDEMATRARQNVEMLVARLTAAGYLFHRNDDARTPDTPFVPASADAATFVERLESLFGPVPMTLSSWIRIVGDVWLVGTHPLWPDSAAGDPLCLDVEGLRYPGSDILDYFEEDHEQWQRDPRGEPFILPVSPDALHKANVSGGGPYGFVLPDLCADAQFVTRGPTPFVSYLNWAFASGGFPQFSGDEREYPVKRALAQGMLPL